MARDTKKFLEEFEFSKLYPMYLAKIEKKERKEAELLQIIAWLTGFSTENIAEMTKNDTNMEDFIEKSNFHPNSALITGVVCGHRVENIEDPFMRKIRYLDKIVDELTKGKSIEKICRTPK